MRKVLIVGSFLACFLLLMVPNVNSIEFQNQKNIITSEIVTMDHASLVKMVKQMPKNEVKLLLKDARQTVLDDPSICDTLKTLFYFFLLLFVITNIVIFEIIFFIFGEFAIRIKCDFVNDPWPV
jgi:hypothetical protein